LGVAGLDKREGRGDDLRALRTHAAAVIYDQADRDGNVASPKEFYILRSTVFVNLKTFFTQFRNEPSFGV
jgi:hypothetical protein